MRKPIIQRFSYSPYKKKKRLLYPVVAAIVLVLYLVPKMFGLPMPEAVPVFNDSSSQSDSLFQRIYRWGFLEEPDDILKQGLPLGAFTSEDGEVGSPNLNQIFNSWVKFITRVEPGVARSLINSQLMALAEAANYEENARVLPPPPPEEIPVLTELKSISRGEVLVGVYNSHNAETYEMTDGVDRLPGKNGGVSEAAQTLAETLEEEYNIKAVYDDTIHDYPRWGASYGNSETTAKKLLQQYPDIRVLIDVHRDAGIPSRETVTIEGKRAAPILLIVGTDTRWDHPNWRKNLAFAKKIEAMMKELYPGLSAGVRPQSGRYNQHLHPHAILAELGSSSNSLGDAEESARLLAGVIARVLPEIE
ncbi:stage II sporulation protein P [Metallumcola ferriviriculae]|uniref:Stage II sporulation protein P n=1 Tax=Metallumcola ferriviriculae TaxID=3039180 RepID=A0AAU0UN25_9FIRM|nr:stage II sporulation protein P [Desulfitibacteraceae bacterium MK1]